jgi:hypothetical protein
VYDDAMKSEKGDRERRDNHKRKGSINQETSSSSKRNKPNTTKGQGSGEASDEIGVFLYPKTKYIDYVEEEKIKLFRFSSNE